MKILDIASFYSDKGGGVKTYHFAKLKYFAEHPEHSYVLLTASDSEGETTLQGGRMIRVKGFPVGWNGAYRQMYDLGRIRRIIAEEEPDIIEAGSPYLDCFLARMGRGVTDAKVVGFYHADVPDSYIAPAVQSLPGRLGNALVGMTRAYMKQIYSRLDMTVVTSKHIEKKLIEMGLRNIARVPLGVDTSFFTPRKRSAALRTDLHVGPSDKLLLFAGRFGKEKGIDTLAEAIRVLDKRKDLKIVLVGDGPHAGRFRGALSECTQTVFQGYESNPKKMAALYASADLFLAPGPHETFGLATLEAMSSGLPVVGADRGGNAELIAASGTGALFRAHDAVDFVHRIDEVLSTDLRLQRLTARSFALRNYSWLHTFDKMIETYQALVDINAAASVTRMPVPARHRDMAAQDYCIEGSSPRPLLRQRVS